MKKTLLIAALAFSIGTKAQSVIDTVSIGAGYAKQTWYSLPNDEQGSAAKSNWDIAFETSGMGSSVFINSVTGTTLWGYPKSDTLGWTNTDTTGITTWTKRYNSDTSWALGAMGRYASATNPFDLDWGQYSMITHYVTGDSIYIIKLANNQYKKLWIVSLISGQYTFKYADLNGSNQQTATITKTNYNTKNLVYYSLQNNATLDREPASSTWDIVFTQYTTFIPTAYGVTGVLHNKGVRTAKVQHLQSPLTYSNYSSQNYLSAINTIGYDWKAYDFNTNSYLVNDSTAYFVKRANGDVWRLVFTGFGGSANGNYIFSKQLMSTTSINGIGADKISFAVYPNPSTGNEIYFSFENGNAQKASISITDLQGRLVYGQSFTTTGGYNVASVQHNFEAGLYIVNLTVNNKTAQQKLIIK